MEVTPIQCCALQVGMPSGSKAFKGVLFRPTEFHCKTRDDLNLLFDDKFLQYHVCVNVTDSQPSYVLYIFRCLYVKGN